MSSIDDYITINRESWNNRLNTHLASEFYGLEAFKNGKSSLNDIELGLLGTLAGKSVLHLQCHFGQDSISLSRLGAHVTGVDLSDKAIEAAKNLAAELGTDTEFICCNLYDLPKYLNRTFDIVFTSYGTIGWLPNMNEWAKLVNQFLKPGGFFIFVEFHPVLWMFDDDFEKLIYSYFNVEMIAETEQGTYADKNAAISQKYVCWNHSLGDVLGNLLETGLQLMHFSEYDYSPYNCFNNTVEIAPQKFRISHLDSKIPMLYALKARKL